MLSSLLVLITVNLFPLYGVVILGWSLFSILFLYWAESFAIGFFTYFKITKSRGTGKVNSSGVPVTNVSASGLPAFFLFHYGLFMFVHLVFIFAFFWPPDFHLSTLVVIGTFFLSHGLSYWQNFLGNREYARFSPEQSMMSPYPRIMVMHLTIIFGAVISKSLNSPPAALVIMILTKTIIDIYSHLASHHQLPAKYTFRWQK